MPRGDRTGPGSAGPGTGRGMGFCTGNDHPGYLSPNSYSGRGYGRQFHGGPGYGRGAGYGYGRGLGNYYQGGLADVSEKTMIENEIRILKDQLSALEGRLSNKE